MVSLEKGNQHLCSGSADHRVSARIGWVWGGLTDFREPVGIRHGFSVDAGIRGSNRGYWPPEIVCVFGVVKSDHVVGKTQVQQCEQPGTLRRCQTVRHRERLRNLVPVVLYCPIPKASGQCLIGSGGRTVDDSDRLDLV